MNDDEIKSTLMPHLGGQFERALPVLFTGAGFSLDAKNVRGQSIPSYDSLKKELWSLCFPGESFDASASLQDLFEHALLRHRTRLTDLMVSLLTVDADSLPDWYRLVFSMPWSRVYTLNVDDLAPAIARKFTLPRDYTPISATGVTEAAVTGLAPGAAEVVHLNGTISDIPDRVTFSVTQYAERLSRPEPWYVRLAADLLSRSVVFIGSRLDEPPLWAHLEFRRGRGGRELRELRPRSYLVTPTLDRARRALLTEFNVAWIPMTAQQFAEQVLKQLQPAARVGLGTISREGAGARSETPNLPEVEKLASNPMQASEFLLGQEPIWADLQSGRAIARESDNLLWEGINRRLKENNKGLAACGESHFLFVCSLM